MGLVLRGGQAYEFFGFGFEGFRIVKPDYLVHDFARSINPERRGRTGNVIQFSCSTSVKQKLVVEL